MGMLNGPRLLLVMILFLLAPTMGAGAGEQEGSYTLNWTYRTDGALNTLSTAKETGYIAAGAGDTYLYLLDESGNLMWRRWIGGRINDVAISNDGTLISVASGDTNIHLIDGNGTQLWTADLGSKEALLTGISGDGSIVAGLSRDPDNRVFLYTKGGNLLWSHKIGDLVMDLAVSEDGRKIAVGTLGGKIYLFNRDGYLEWTTSLGPRGLSKLDINRNGSLITALSRFSEVNLINETGTILWTRETSSQAGAVQYLDGDKISVYAGDGLLTIYSTGGEELISRELGSGIQSLSLQAEGSYIAAAYGMPDTGVYRYDLVKSPSPVKRKEAALVANSIDIGLAKGLIEYLRNSGIDLQVISPREFGEVNEKDYLLILGGPDAPEGVGEIVSQILDPWERNQIRIAGSRKMIIKPDVWSKGQEVILLAGADREGTKRAHEFYRARLAAKILGV